MKPAELSDKIAIKALCFGDFLRSRMVLTAILR